MIQVFSCNWTENNQQKNTEKIFLYKRTVSLLLSDFFNSLMRSRQNQPFWFKTYFSFFLPVSLSLESCYVVSCACVCLYASRGTYTHKHKRTACREGNWRMYLCSGFFLLVACFLVSFAEWLQRYTFPMLRCCTCSGVSATAHLLKRVTHSGRSFLTKAVENFAFFLSHLLGANNDEHFLDFFQNNFHDSFSFSSSC